MKIKKNLLILVDKEDNILGCEEKAKCHLGKGLTHRAFSIFVFNDKKEVLIQKRAKGKMLWPGFWANACCSHPRKGENYKKAAKRRLKEEMGINTNLKSVFKFYYQAKYENIGSENELCAVLVGRHGGDKINPHPEEVEEWKWIGVKELKEDIKNNPDIYVPWFKIEMEKIGEIIDKLREM
ncbi:isopentenyl-diphosphate Delta-isomerase [bacterium]|nr:MAG: isopentenyl-diphosphate Delta-isomerase [bacterium]